MKRLCIVLPVLAALLLLGGAILLAQNGYDLSWWTVDGGGDTSSGGSYTMAGTAGQPDAAPALSGDSYTLEGGFWHKAPPTNTAPTLSGLPDLVFDQGNLPPGTVDLWAYASDPETTDDGLTYTLEDTPPAGAGVTLSDNRTITANPSTDWCGYVDITARVTDPGGLWDEDTFRVEVTWSCQGPLPVAAQ